LAYENRPSTNPRGCGGNLWGFRLLPERYGSNVGSAMAPTGTRRVRLGARRSVESGACRSRCSGLQSRSWRKARGWRSPEQRALRLGVSVCCAGSRRRPGCCGSAGRRARLHLALEGFDDVHAPAAARATRAPIERFCRFDSLRLGWRRRHGKQFTGARNIELARRAAAQGRHGGSLCSGR
jgi:hypothetical protein